MLNKMNEKSYQRQNLDGSLEKYKMIGALAQKDLESGNRDVREHAKIIFDSAKHLENMMRRELGEPIEGVYAQPRVGENK